MSASSSEDDEGDPLELPDPLPYLPDGVRPPDRDCVDIDTWERVTGRTLTEDDVERVAPLVSWCFVSPTL